LGRVSVNKITSASFIFRMLRNDDRIPSLRGTKQSQTQYKRLLQLSILLREASQ